jgi:hypothetical protein
MASNEGIGSPFPKQPSERSPKLRIYESLFLLNEGVDHLVALLRDMEKLPFAEKESLQCAVVEIEEVRCDVNADFTEKLADSERFDEGQFWKQRRDFEKTWRDPDDVYIEVQRREEERKKQGLPPRLGVLPHSAVAEREHELQVEPQRQKTTPKKAARRFGRKIVAKKRKIGRGGTIPTPPNTSKERKQIAKQIETERERLRKIYPEVQGEVVDFIV